MNLFHRLTKRKITELNYKEGKLSGIQKRWYDNGQLSLECFCDKNNYVRKQFNYRPNGILDYYIIGLV